MEYDAVVFDSDGVLVEPTDWDVIRGAVRTAFEALGVEDYGQEHVDGLIGVDVADVREVADDLGVDADALWYERDTAASAAQVELLEDGGKPRYEDVDAIPELPAPRGVVSNNQQATVDAVVDRYDLDRHVGPVYGREPTLTDVGRKKPEPFYLERALEDLGVDPDAGDAALYVGDSPKDLETARRAGIDAAFVRRDHRVDVELPFEPALEVEHLGELWDALS